MLKCFNILKRQQMRWYLKELIMIKKINAVKNFNTEKIRKPAQPTVNTNIPKSSNSQR